MIFGQRKPKLFQCRISHTLSGRIRLRCPAISYLNDETDDIARRIEEIGGVHSAKVTTLTGGMLILYDPVMVSEADLTDAVEQIMSLYVLPVIKETRYEAMRNDVQERRLQEEPVSKIAARAAAAGAALFLAALRRRPQQTSGPFFQRFFNMEALTSISLAWPLMRSGAEALVQHGRPNADTLSTTAIAASLAAGRSTSALAIILLADIAELLTAYSMDRTRKAIRKLLSVGEDLVWRLRSDGTREKISLSDVMPDDVILAHTGEKISADGTVIEGSALVDQASITGEFLPITKKPGDIVFAGTLVKSGSIALKAVKVGDDTAVSRIIHLVEEASQRKAIIQAYADRFSAQFIPVNFALAAVVFLITRSTTRALNMLIIDYSCGVRLSTATALSVAISTAASQGVLIKGGNYLEQLAEADTLILDKTGTVTKGKPVVSKIVCADAQITPKMVIETAAAAEQTSSHPMAAAVLAKARTEGWKIPRHSHDETVVGRGVRTQVGKKTVLVGSRKFMQENQIDSAKLHDEVSRIALRGEHVIYVAKDGRLLGIIGLQDALKDNMKKALNRLRKTGIDDIVLLTGDVEQQAELIAARISADSYHSEVLPETKSEVVLRLQAMGSRVIMVGDGINDAPALAYSDVGIAMGGTRTDVTIEASDITITHDDPLLLPATVNLARSTMSIIKQNFAAAIGVNTIGLVLGSLGVLPVFWGAVLHNSTTIAVVFNSLRIVLYDLKKKG